MAIEALKEIRETELEAERAIKSARDEARRIVAEAREKAREIVAAAIEAARSEADRLIAGAEAEGQAEAISIRKSNEELCESIIKVARDRKARAVNLVVEKVVKAYGHS
ncbi:MAG TPA: hypothetical protein GXX51_11465 [Firmicutes bacterium]|nr:hypothetical protein [Bacillota bacterium]